MRLRSLADPRGAIAEARDGETGAVTAEFAVALPAVVGVLALCLGAVGAVSTHTILTSVAVDSARVWARGESWDAVQASVALRQPAATAVGTETGGAGGDVSRDGTATFALGERCVSLSMPLRLGSWIELGIVIEETACAPIEP